MQRSVAAVRAGQKQKTNPAKQQGGTITDMKSFFWATTALYVALFPFISPAFAQRDITYGGDARAFAMGGAGIALVGDALNGGTTRVNPASLAFETQPFGVSFPSFALRGRGPVSLGSASNYLLRGQDLSDAASLTRDFASRDSDFAVNANVGFRAGKFEVGGYAVARGRIQPSETLKSWASGGQLGGLSGLATNARSDIFAAGYYTLPTVAAATTLPVRAENPYNFAVGGRVKYMTGIYTHYVADRNTLVGLSPITKAPEMNGRESLTKKGVGADLGFLMRRRDNTGPTFAAVLTNAINPNLRFDGTDRFGNTKKYNLLATTLALGAGLQLRNSTFAADLTNIGQGTPEFRAGAEQRFLGKFALRGGYSTSTSFTYGFSFFGLDIALGKRQPLEVVKTLSF